MTMPGTRPKLLHLAINLKQGFDHEGNIPSTGKEAHIFAQMGMELQYYLDNAYRRAGGHKPTRAAHYKRLAKKRRIQRAREKK